jgi:hypothetical protein
MAARCCAHWYDGQPCDRSGVVLNEARGGWVCYVHAPPGPQEAEAIRATLRQAMTRPDRYLAAALAEETDASLAAQLGCPTSVVYRLRLCGWPRADRWDADVALIADTLGADQSGLAGAIYSGGWQPQPDSSTAAILASPRPEYIGGEPIHSALGENGTGSPFVQ